MADTFARDSHVTGGNGRRAPETGVPQRLSLMIGTRALDEERAELLFTDEVNGCSKAGVTMRGRRQYE